MFVVDFRISAFVFLSKGFDYELLFYQKGKSLFKRAYNGPIMGPYSGKMGGMDLGRSSFRGFGGAF